MSFVSSARKRHGNVFCVKCQKKILQCLLCQVPGKDIAMSFVSSARKRHCNVFCVKCQKKILQCLFCQVPEKDIAMFFVSSARKRHCNVFCIKCQKMCLRSICEMTHPWAMYFVSSPRECIQGMHVTIHVTPRDRT